jgi:hypothetical protein
MANTSVTLCAIFRIPAEGVAAFRAYEDAVLPLLGEHGGRLDRRLRSADGRMEVHIVSFNDDAAFAAYRADERRKSRAQLLEASGASVDVVRVNDVEDA